jgi:hypothetical protein
MADFIMVALLRFCQKSFEKNIKLITQSAIGCLSEFTATPVLAAVTGIAPQNGHGSRSPGSQSRGCKVALWAVLIAGGIDCV